MDSPRAAARALDPPLDTRLRPYQHGITAHMAPINSLVHGFIYSLISVLLTLSFYYITAKVNTIVVLVQPPRTGWMQKVKIP